MAAKKKSQHTSSPTTSSRPSSAGASSGPQGEAPAQPAEKSAHRVDPGPIKLHSPIGPLMWVIVPFVLAVLIALLKK